MRNDLQTRQQTSTKAPGTSTPQELEENAQKTAYTQVPTQEQMLRGGQPVSPAEQQCGDHCDHHVTNEMDELLHEMAQQGNIGGD